MNELKRRLRTGLLWLALGELLIVSYVGMSYYVAVQWWGHLIFLVGFLGLAVLMRSINKEYFVGPLALLLASLFPFVFLFSSMSGFAWTSAESLDINVGLLLGAVVAPVVALVRLGLMKNSYEKGEGSG